MSRFTLQKISEECGAYKKIGRKIIIDVPKLDEYIEHM
jgi:hypothetical protein